MTEVLTYLDMKDRAFRDLRKAGEFPEPLRLGHSIRWRWGTVREWLRAVETVQRLTPRMMGGRKRRKPAESGKDRQSSAEGPLPPSKPPKAR